MSRRERSLAVVLAVALLVTPLAGSTQSPATAAPSGAISGTVIDTGSDQPVAGAKVSLGRDGGEPADPVITDDRGHFAFSHLSAGRWLLRASHAAYAPGAYGARSPRAAGQPLDLAADERVTDAVVRLWKFASVSGTATDSNREPIVGVTVMAAPVQVVNGRASFGRDRIAKTDDRGAYRLTGITPGRYAIVLLSPASSSPGATGYSATGFPTLFYPGTPAPAAAMIMALGSGDDRTDMHFAVDRFATHSVSGQVLGLDASRPGRLALRLRPAEPGGPAANFDVRTATADAQGQFAFAGVLPGQYLLSAIETPPLEEVPRGSALAWRNPNASVPPDQVGQRFAMFMAQIMGSASPAPLAPSPLSPKLWADVPITVEDKDLDRVAVVLQPAAFIGGRVVFDGSAAKPTAEALASTPVTVASADGRDLVSLRLSGISADGGFRTESFTPGDYQVAVERFPGWSLESITLRGRDLLHASIQLGAEDITDLVMTYTDRPAQLSGVVRSSNGTPAPDATIYLFPSDRHSWTNSVWWSGTTREIRPARNGAYQATVPPGEYYLVAVVNDAREDWTLVEGLESLATNAATVKIERHATVVRDLKVSGR
jgi:hypothetical protein